MDALTAHRARGERPLLVVPTHADVERYRLELGERELTSEGVAAGAGVVVGAGPRARVVRFQGLLAETLRRAGSAERPLGRLARERALAVVLRRANGEPPTAGVVRSLATLVGELEVERVTPARLRGALDAWAAADPGHAPHARQLGELFEGYRRGLERLRPARVSPERQATQALDALRRTPALWGSTPVLLYGFDDFTRLQLDAIETLGAVVGAPVTVSLTYEPGRAAFASRGDTFQRLLPLAAEHLPLAPRAEHYAPGAATALHHLERHIFELDAPAPVPAGAALRAAGGRRGTRRAGAGGGGDPRAPGARGAARRDRRRAPLPGDDRGAAGGGVRCPTHPLRLAAAALLRAHRHRPRAAGPAESHLPRCDRRRRRPGRSAGVAARPGGAAQPRARGRAGVAGAARRRQQRGARTRAVGGRARAAGDARGAARGGEAESVPR